MNIPEKKSELRAAISARLSRMSDKDRATESRTLCKRILESLPKEPTGICAYYPLKDEADLRPLLRDILAHGHTLYLPRKEGAHFVFGKVTTLDALPPDDFGIPAPSDDSPLLEPSDLTIALIPGRAFDKKGNRLGRGNGGYDIWIRKQRMENPKTQFWGIALECQVVQDIPMEAHDEHVDAIVTARGVDKTR